MSTETDSAISEVIAPTPSERPVALESLVGYHRQHAESLASPELFWGGKAGLLSWAGPPQTTLRGRGPGARWFSDGLINASVNCLDRHVETGRGENTALHWEGEATGPDRRPLEQRSLSYRELLTQTALLAGVLARLGVRPGDRVTISLPVVPELVVAMLAVARLGAVHNVVFAGFPPAALRDRLVDSGSRLVITADGGRRQGKPVALKAVFDEALAGETQVETVLVLRRTGVATAWHEGRDRWWHEEVARQEDPAPAYPVSGDAPLFLMYTSGSTGRPKGIVHGTAGYLLHTLESARHAFDLQPGDIFWCTADPAWITGHTYTVYAPLLSGATTLLLEGALSAPDWDRAWDVIDRHKPRVLYTTPTLIRAWQRHGEATLRQRDLSSLRILGSVGEPIQPSLWHWFRDTVGAGRTPLVDTWWQTEVGAAAIFPLPHATPAKPGSASLPFLGIAPVLLDAEGNELEGEASGQLALSQAWPGQALGIWGDEARYLGTYWAHGDTHFLTGDAARRDADGYLWIRGRIDDVIKVNGHRLGTAEIEGALACHEAVSESAVVGIPDAQSGEAVAAFVILRDGHTDTEALRRELRTEVETRVGKLARPQSITVLPQLPKNRSGKILRRVLREHAQTGTITGDLSTLDDSGALAALVQLNPKNITP